MTDVLVCEMCKKDLYDSPIIHSRQATIFCSIECMIKHRNEHNQDLPDRYCNYCEIPIESIAQNPSVNQDLTKSTQLCYNNDWYCCKQHLLVMNENVNCSSCKTDMTEQVRTNTGLFIRKNNICCKLECMLQNRKVDPEQSNTSSMCNLCECPIVNRKEAFYYMNKMYCCLAHLHVVQRNDQKKEEDANAKRFKGRIQHFTYGGTTAF